MQTIDKQSYFELHYNYYEYADHGVSTQGNKKGIEKFLSFDAARSAADNILRCIKYHDNLENPLTANVSDSEAIDLFISQFNINGFFKPGVEIFEIENIIKKKLVYNK